MGATEGWLRARLAATDRDIEAAQKLRHLAFAGSSADGRDADSYDAESLHLMIECRADGRLLATCRLRVHCDGTGLPSCYSGQFYDLAALRARRGPMLELGRFCTHPSGQDPDILRLAWAALTRIVDSEGIELMFGCSSFAGIEPAAFHHALAALACHHVGPADMRPAKLWAETVDLCAGAYDARLARAQMPPLLRGYLGMGGWVSDHAVVDRALGTLHVFTAVEIASIPPARTRLLRADATLGALTFDTVPHT